MKQTKINNMKELFLHTNPDYHQSQAESIMSNDTIEKLCNHSRSTHLL